MFTYFLHLGSNVGDRKKMLFQAIQHIQVQIGKVVIQSSVYETEPWGLTDQANFYNMAVKVHSTKNP